LQNKFNDKKTMKKSKEKNFALFIIFLLQIQKITLPLHLE